jgi:dolichol-phosphate mannosyltransferase
VTPVVLLPTYDEAENIEGAVARVLEHLPQAHVLVIDDNSPDGTGRIADGIASGDGRVHVLHRPGKEGLGRAYLAGFQWALARDYDRIFEMDADGSHPADRLPALLDASGDADIVLGSRWVSGGGAEGWTLRRRLLSKGGSLYARTILGVGIRDLTGGFKCFTRSALQSLDLSTIRSEGYSFQIELTYRAIRRGLTVVEVPIVFRDRTVGESKMSAKIFGEALARVWEMRLRG